MNFKVKSIYPSTKGKALAYGRVEYGCLSIDFNVWGGPKGPWVKLGSSRKVGEKYYNDVFVEENSLQQLQDIVLAAMEEMEPVGVAELVSEGPVDTKDAAMEDAIPW